MVKNKVRRAEIDFGAAVGVERVVGYVVRRGLVLLSTLAVFSTEVFAALQRGMQWRGDLIWSVDWISVSFIVVGPVLAGVVAVDIARLTVGVDNGAGRGVGRDPSLMVATVHAVAVIVAHLLVIVGVLIVSSPGRWMWTWLLALAVQLLILTFFVSLGLVAGRFFGPILAGILAAGAAFGLVVLLSSVRTYVSPFVLGASVNPRIGRDYHASYLLFQIFILVLLVGACLAVRRTISRRAATVGAVIAVAMVTLAATMAVNGPKDRLILSGEASECGWAQGVEMCFYPEHKRIAEQFVQTLWVIGDDSVAEGWAALLPDRLVEIGPAPLAEESANIGFFYVSSEHLQGVPVTVEEIVSGIVMPIHCPQVQQEMPPAERYWEDLDLLIVSWATAVDPSTPNHWGWLDSEFFTPQEAAVLLEQFRTCTYPHF